MASIDSRPDPRATRTARLEAARGELAAATERGEGGRHALRQYSHRMDAMVQQVFADAGAAAQSVAVFALGGYGRRHLCLHSDIDLLILFAGTITAEDERFLGAFMTPLWDLGLTLGHHVREVKDGAGLADDNAEFLLALTDARVIVGDATLLDQFFGESDVPRTAARTLDALKTLVAERRARFNDTLYQLEPDVKEAPGALRDLFAARTMAKLTDPALLGQGGSTLRALEDAEEFLFRVRSILHRDTNRHHDVLGHELQERAAEHLGYPGSSPRRRVERMMSDYFRHARAIDRTLRWALKAVPVPIGPNLVRSTDGVRFVDVHAAAERPETWLALFEAAIAAGVCVSDEAINCVQQHAARFAAEDFFPTREHKAALLRFLRPRPGLYARLSEMHDTGLLGQMVPEFKAISFLVVRDFYHKYTVDEHTLLTIRGLERLADPGRASKRTASHERFSRLLVELASPELLVLSLLLHDCGKGSGKKHEEESVRMAHVLFDRLGLDESQRGQVEFLIAQHLKMSLAAFRRDTEDPEVVRQFAELVGVEERLKMLCLMTLVDVAAVSPETLTPWKEELLWRLYVDTYNYLTHAYADEVIDARQAALNELIERRPEDLSAEEVAAFLEGLPRRYLQLFSPEAVYRQARSARSLGEDAVQGWLDRRDSGWELTVLTRDRPFLFSNICGVLSSAGMHIQRGFAFTKPNGLVVDTFHFLDQEQFIELNPGADAQLIQAIDDAVHGRMDVGNRLRGREQGAFRRRLPAFAPVVHCDDESSRRYTIVEIIAEDAFGLLYRLSRAMSESGCAVDLVLIATEGRRAIDVFHLTKAGEKLSAQAQRDLTDNLQRVLEGGP